MNRYLTKEDTQMANKHMKRCCTSYTIESESEVAQSCPTLCDPMDCSSPGSSIHGIFQARILEGVANSFSRGFSQPTDRTWVSGIVGRRFTIWASREPHTTRELQIRKKKKKTQADTMTFQNGQHSKDWQHQMLVRIWINKKSHSSVVVMQNGRATLEDSLQVS